MWDDSHSQYYLYDVFSSTYIKQNSRDYTKWAILLTYFLSQIRALEIHNLPWVNHSCMCHDVDWRPLSKHANNFFSDVAVWKQAYKSACTRRCFSRVNSSHTLSISHSDRDSAVMSDRFSHIGTNPRFTVRCADDRISSYSWTITIFRCWETKSQARGYVYLHFTMPSSRNGATYF